ncbi:MAG: YqgE/AlgH family protein [Bacteroidetes bacterium]|nr:YqgE/AlgH family protein [Bacteroidota bacterium]
MKKPEKGTLLLAEPMLQDPNFKRTVILLCEHSETGSFGLVLNKELPLLLNEVLPENDLPELPLFLGGPVQPDTLHVLHSAGEKITGAIEVAEGVWWGGEFEDIKTKLSLGLCNTTDFRFFLGYSGWAEEQLQDELDRGGWILGRCNSDYIFETEPEKLWRKILKDMGGEFAQLANYPENPHLN